jgi:hypothetical protein
MVLSEEIGAFGTTTQQIQIAGETLSFRGLAFAAKEMLTAYANPA